MKLKEFHEQMKNDPALAKEYLEFFKKNDDGKVKELTKEVAKKLNELQANTAKAFAESKGFTFEADTEGDAVIATINKDICKQMDKLIVDQMSKGNL